MQLPFYERSQKEIENLLNDNLKKRSNETKVESLVKQLTELQGL